MLHNLSQQRASPLVAEGKGAGRVLKRCPHLGDLSGILWMHASRRTQYVLLKAANQDGLGVLLLLLMC